MFLRTLAALMIFGSPAMAETPPAESGRYTFSHIEGGAMRLDTRTGAVSHCTKRGSDWACRAVADDRAAYEAEIARLSAANQTLARDLDDLKRRLEPDRAGSPPSPPATVPDTSRGKPPEDAITRNLPTDADIDRMMSVVEKMFRRFVAMVESLKPGSTPPDVPKPQADRI